MTLHKETYRPLTFFIVTLGTEVTQLGHKNAGHLEEAAYTSLHFYRLSSKPRHLKTFLRPFLAFGFEANVQLSLVVLNLASPIPAISTTLLQFGPNGITAVHPRCMMGQLVSRPPGPQEQPLHLSPQKVCDDIVKATAELNGLRMQTGPG